MSDDLFKRPGPFLLLAGPGTGKTYRLARRIKYLVEEAGASPHEIAVITFTGAAARNMRDMISDEAKADLFVPPSQQPRCIRTMHSLGLCILEDKLARLPFTCETVVTSTVLQGILCGDAAQICGYQRLEAGEIIACRRHGLCKKQAIRKCTICEKYERILRACSAIDYDDQILLACTMLRGRPELLAKYQTQCRHLLVDEYQDINAAQFDLVWLLSAKHRDGLFVVGDDDQSIYSWRGGSPEFIRRFKDHFGQGSAVHALQVSYRCHAHVLEGATGVVSKFDADRIKKGPFTYKVAEGPKIQIHSTASDKKEASLVLSIIKHALPSRSVLVLVPHRGYANALCTALFRAKIPFTGMPSEPGDGLPTIVDLGRWIANPTDSLSLRKCMAGFLDNNPDVPSSRSRKPEKKKLLEGILKQISDLWRPILSKDKGTLWECLEAVNDNSLVPARCRDAFLCLLKLHSSGSATEFVGAVNDALGVWASPAAVLDESEAWVSQFEQVSSQGQGSGMRIMTLQGAKGLEAHVVCVLGVEEGSLPRSDEEEHIAEAARLFYVSATRAIQELHLFRARKRAGGIVFRNLYERGGPPDLRSSRFLSHIAKQHKEEIYHPA